MKVLFYCFNDEQYVFAYESSAGLHTVSGSTTLDIVHFLATTGGQLINDETELRQCCENWYARVGAQRLHAAQGAL
jgi:hypothetical protein